MEVFESLPPVSRDCVPRVGDTILDSLNVIGAMFMDVFFSFFFLLALPTQELNRTRVVKVTFLFFSGTSEVF